MKTALDIINRAASKIGVKRAGSPLEDDEITDAISELNNMMLELDASGTKLGYTVVSDSSDEITTPDWSYGAIEGQLAIRLAPEYEVSISQELAAQASASWNTVLKRTVSIGHVQFPSTLPIGSGNQYYYWQRFFLDGYANDLETGAGGTLADTEDLNIQED